MMTSGHWVPQNGGRVSRAAQSFAEAEAGKDDLMPCSPRKLSRPKCMQKMIECGGVHWVRSIMVDPPLAKYTMNVSPRTNPENLIVLCSGVRPPERT